MAHGGRALRRWRWMMPGMPGMPGYAWDARDPGISPAVDIYVYVDPYSLPPSSSPAPLPPPAHQLENVPRVILVPQSFFPLWSGKEVLPGTSRTS
jgi:hypothetical protein